MRYRHEDEPQPATAEQLLTETYNNEKLTQLLRITCPGVKVTRKDAMLAELLALLEEEKLPALLEKLTPLQRDAVAEVAWSSDGKYDAEQFEAKYGKSPWREPTGVDPSPAPYYGERKLRLLDLIIVGDVMARDVQNRLQRILPEPAPAQILASDVIPDTIEREVSVWERATNKSHTEVEHVPIERRETGRAAMHNLRAVLRLVEAGKISVTEKNRWPTPGAMKQVLGVLEGGDYYVTAEQVGARATKRDDEENEVGPICAFAWPMLVQVGGLAEYRGGKLALTKAGRAALMEEPHEVIREVWERWVEEDEVDELRRINVIRGQTGNGRRKLSQPSTRREAICEALCECPVGKWVEVDRFSQYMQAAGHKFDVTHDSWTLYVAEQQYGSLALDGNDGWNILQLRYILVLLMEYAATLGLVDVAYVPPEGAREDYGGMWGTDDLSFFSRYDGLMHFRLTGLGAYCLGKTESYTPPARVKQTVLEVMPDLTINELGELAAADRMLLEAFAEKTGERQWHLERDKALAALGEGRSVEELAQLLRATTDVELPERVLGFLGEVTRHANAFSDAEPSRLFRCNDPEMLATVLRHPATAKLCTRSGEDLLVVPEKSEAAFRKAMRTLGFALLVG